MEYQIVSFCVSTNGTWIYFSRMKKPDHMLVFYQIHKPEFYANLCNSGYISETYLKYYRKRTPQFYRSKKEVKIQLAPCLLNEALSYEDIPGTGIIAHTFLTTTLDRGEWSASRPGIFTVGDTAPGTNWTGGWVDLRLCLDASEKRKILNFRESNPDHPARRQCVYRLRYSEFKVN
jgi:hypothetical protein